MSVNASNLIAMLDTFTNEELAHIHAAVLTLSAARNQEPVERFVARVLANMGKAKLQADAHRHIN